MRRTILLLMVAGLMATGSLKAQHHFKATSLSEALIALDHSTERYDISFVYDELEDFTVTTDIRKSSSVPDAVRQVCGFYPVKVSVKGRNIFVECIQKDRTKLTGRLVDAHNQPIAYANILLYHPSDSTVIGGGVSNEAGDFVIPCSAHEARVKVSCIGYKTLERTLPIGNVGTLRLQTANIYLGPVSVSGHASVIRSEADRLSYIVSRDAFARELTAMELLNRVPMVSVTGGNASILGKGPAHFMLNGRMVEHDGETIRQKLWSMRAEDIERIEVISVPSGEYQTEAGGYINIVLNTAQSQGWRADLSGQYVKNDKWSSRYTVDAYSDRFNASLSYASPKVDFSLDLQSSYHTNSVETESDYKDIRLGKNSFDKHSDMRIARRYNNSGINTLLRWRPSERLELGAMLSRQLPGFTMISEDEAVWSETNKQLYYYDKLSKGEHYSNYPKRNPTIKEITQNNEDLLKGIPLQKRTFFYHKEKLIYGEDVQIEYKNFSFPFNDKHKEEFKKQICAFLNSKGGRIFIGITDDKIVNGISLNYHEKDKNTNDIVNLTYDFYPKCRTYVDVCFIPIKSKDNKYIKNLYVIKIIVSQGETNQLYSYTSKGFMSYLRLKGQCIFLTAEEIKKELSKREKDPEKQINPNEFKDPEPDNPELVIANKDFEPQSKSLNLKDKNISSFENNKQQSNLIMRIMMKIMYLMN